MPAGGRIHLCMKIIKHKGACTAGMYPSVDCYGRTESDTKEK